MTMKPSYFYGLPAFLLLVCSLNDFKLCAAVDPAKGSTQAPLTDRNFELQKPYDIPLAGRYSYENGVHKLWVYATDKPHDPNSHTQPRTVIRIKVIN